MEITAGFIHKDLETPQFDKIRIAIGGAVLDLCSSLAIYEYVEEGV
jgi:hypothetical protein